MEHKKLVDFIIDKFFCYGKLLKNQKATYKVLGAI